MKEKIFEIFRWIGLILLLLVSLIVALFKGDIIWAIIIFFGFFAVLFVVWLIVDAYKSKKYKEIFILNHKLFGEMSTVGNPGRENIEWKGKSNITLWDSNFDIELVVCVLEHSSISNEQEAAYESYKQNLPEIQSGIEKEIEKFYKTNDISILTEKFKPYKLVLRPDGNCTLIAEDRDAEFVADDVDTDIAIQIYPEFLIRNADD